MKLIPVGVSNHHVHLSEHDMVKLFGKEKLEIFREIRQPGQFAAKETVNLIGKSIIWNVRVVGPLRKETQVEIMRKDQDVLGIKAPILVSGNSENSPGTIIQGSHGAIKIEKGVIIAKTHVHLSNEEAQEFGLNNGDLVDVYHDNKLITENVVIRSGGLHKSDFHIDKEEAKYFGLKNNDLIELRF
jgi:putative phosphotransacetylase